MINDISFNLCKIAFLFNALEWRRGFESSTGTFELENRAFELDLAGVGNPCFMVYTLTRGEKSKENKIPHKKLTKSLLTSPLPELSFPFVFV